MRVAITGSTGLIGSALVQALRWRGDEVVRLCRRDPISPDERRIDLRRGTIADPGLDDVDAVVNLAGASIAGARWSLARKREILESRVEATTAVVSNLSADGRCQRLLQGSAIGFYGNSPPGESIDESSPRGEGFLSDVAVAWEAAASQSPVATTYVRTGNVLSPRGGYVGQQLILFKSGLGGRMGDGTQRVSWISLDDHVRASLHLLDHDLTGPVNLTAPEPVTNKRLTRALGVALHRPTVLPVPLPALRLVLGNQMVDEALLADQAILPARLLESHFSFLDPQVEPALDRLLSNE